LVQADLAGLSDRGKVRPTNEDHYLVVRFGRYLEALCTNLPEGTVPARSRETGYGMVVADGMGGRAAGEVASRLAIQTLVRLVLNVPDWILRPDDAWAAESLRRAAERFRQVNAVVTDQANAEPALYSMGTTMTVAWSLGADLFIAHMGDSRAYLFRRENLHQLTRDHTLAQELADYGQITQAEVATHRLRHVLTQVLGRETADVKPEVQRLQLADGDYLLLCTDGLTEMVEAGAIAEVLGCGEEAEATCRRLVDRALERGGKDNVTVVMARYRILPSE
jgi:protein phosphatase